MVFVFPNRTIKLDQNRAQIFSRFCKAYLKYGVVYYKGDHDIYHRAS